MKIKGLFMKVMLLNKQLIIFCSNQNLKLEHVTIQFRFHNIHISDQTQLAKINMPFKWHHIDTCKNKL
jgi:hypothetical protein